MPPRRMEMDDAGSDDFISDDDDLYDDASRKKGGKGGGKAAGKKRDKGKGKSAEVNITCLLRRMSTVLQQLCGLDDSRTHGKQHIHALGIRYARTSRAVYKVP